MKNTRQTLNKRQADILAAIQALKDQNMPVTIKEVCSLTGLPYHIVYGHKELHEQMNIRATAPYKKKQQTPKREFTPAASMYDRYVTIIKDLCMTDKPMSKHDFADEIEGMGLTVNVPDISRAINSLLASRDLMMDGNGLYRLAKEQSTTTEAPAVLMDEKGTVTVLEPGQSALQIAEKLIRAGAQKIIHLLPTEVFEPTTAVISRRF
ncbi:hypothetical protein AWB71_02579 [Caballeronia peredens]|nr:hypothetical protein AWB71_02579 [Caballeronia peredens]